VEPGRQGLQAVGAAAQRPRRGSGAARARTPTAKVNAKVDGKPSEAAFEEGRWRIKMPAGSRAYIEAVW